MNNFKYTAEDLLELKSTKILLHNYSDKESIKHKIIFDLAKTRNYKPHTYFHATGSLGEIGLGKGLYLGRDRRALRNFYNGDGTRGKIEKYVGKLNFIDLVIDYEFNIFEKKAINIFGCDDNKEYFKKLTLKLKKDGIRYYDPIATGEEFVAFNISSLIKVQ